jgi:hypothetical protein
MISGGHRDKLLRRFGGALLEHQRRPRSAANAVCRRSGRKSGTP